jgi:2-desacetyl-2-hydroxyethyl bacteriochlorophyllide A dehydrogenase
MRSRLLLLFNGDGTTQLTAEPVSAPTGNEVGIQTQCTLISAGTERLVLNGQVDPSLQDTTADGTGFSYPRPYGYCTVGRVVSGGADATLPVGGRVFGFLPHATHHVVPETAVYPLPDGLSTPDATFIPNVETALNIVWDAQVGPGSRVVLIGTGTVGMLVVRLLRTIPALDLAVVDQPHVLDRIAARLPDAHCYSPDAFSRPTLPPSWSDGPDVVIECSGQPAMLQRALDVAGQETRVVMGSWYGTKSVELDLGAAFHRKRLTVAATPVSTLPAERKTRWSKDRQLRTAMTLSADLSPAQPHTRFVDFREAPAVYATLRSGALPAPTILVMSP